MNLISPKVVAAASGAGAGGVVSGLIFWVIGTTAYGVPATAGSVSEAIAAVPSPIVGVVGLLFVVLGAGIPGYQAVDPLRVVPEEEAPTDNGFKAIAEKMVDPVVAPDEAVEADPVVDVEDPDLVDAPPLPADEDLPAHPDNPK